MEKSFKKYLLIGTVLLTAGFFVPDHPTYGASGIIINEIAYDLPGSDEDHEWIELYNAGTASIDLKDWKFNDGSNHVLNPPPEKGSRGSLVMASGDYLLLAADAIILASDIPSYSSTIIDTAINLNNTAATLKLINKDGQEIASASYSKSLGANGNGKTLEWDGSAFKESSATGGTPGKANSVYAGAPLFFSPSPSPSANASPIPATNSPAPTTSSAPTTAPVNTPTPYQYSQNIYINEFMPYSEKEQPEWVELFNSGSQALNLAGWGIIDSETSHQPFQISSDAKIEPGAYLVVTLSKSFLNNDGDQVTLLWPDGQVVHSVSYQKAKQNFSVARFADQWLWTNQPTPGQPNKKSLTQSLSTGITKTTETTLDAPLTVTALRETVVEQKLSSQKTNPLPAKSTPQPLASFSSTSPSQTFDSKNNLTAAVSEPIIKNSNPKTFLTLVALIVFSALAALGLIYFRRRLNPIDKEKSNQ